MSLEFLKKTTLLIFFLCTSFLFAKEFNTKATIKNIYLVQKKAKYWGAYSGENLVKTYKTNYIVKLSDKNHKQYASIRFLAQDWDAIKSRAEEILVVDVVSQKFIDARKAFFVVNSKAKSKYSKYSKLAFKNKEDAQSFVKKYGGDIRDFDFTFYLASRDIKVDIDYFKKKTQRVYKKGKRIYKRACNGINLKEYGSLIDLKKSILDNKYCGKLKEKNLQALSLYLWNIKRFGELKINNKRLKVPKGAKCPVCGMFVAKYPKWATKIELENKAHYFDGVKDMLKFYFHPLLFGAKSKKLNIKAIRVTDYYSLNEIDGTKAWYVLGSNIYGPMGHELIPFEHKEDAKTFKDNHNAKRVLSFKEITMKILFKIDK